MSGDRKRTLGFIAPMEARLVDALPAEAGWQFEPKWDGFRCLAVRDGADVRLFAKSGKPLGRYFPEILARLASFRSKRFVLDGELVIPIDGRLSFDALQMRLHPAESRVRRLSAETPALYVLFDVLVAGARDVTALPLRERRAILETFLQAQCGADIGKGIEPAAIARTPAGARRAAGVRLSPATTRRATAQRWLDRSRGALDGLIAKPLDVTYESGERAVLKWKQLRTADCVVGGFRYETKRKQVASLLLGLYDDEGKLDHVGFTSSIPAKDRPALTRKLEALREPPGFTGRAPGGPSRWTTARSAEWQPLAPKLVVEVCYDHVSGDRFRHGTRLVRWRPDKAPRQCTFEQIGPGGG